MIDADLDTWVALEVDAGAGSVPSLVGSRLAGRVVAAEVLDVEEGSVVHRVHDPGGQLARFGITLTLQVAPSDSRWVLELSATEGERVMVIAPAAGDDLPQRVAEALEGILVGVWSWGPPAVQVRAVRRLLDDSSSEIGQVVDELARPQDVVGTAPGSTRRILVRGVSAEARAQLAELAFGTPRRARAPAFMDGWTSATAALVDSAVALRLDLPDAADQSQAAVRSVLAAGAIRRQLDGTPDRDLRLDADWWDGVLSELTALDLGARALLTVLTSEDALVWLTQRLAAERRDLLAGVEEALATTRWRELISVLADTPRTLPEAHMDVLSALADRSLRRVERRLAELGRAQPDHDVLWLVGGCRRAVARARFPGLLGADGRAKRARGLGDLLAATDTVLADLGAAVRGESLAARLAAEAPAEAVDDLVHAARRLRQARAAVVVESADLRARLRRRRKG